MIVPPICLRELERRPRATAEEVRREEDLHSVLLGVFPVLRIRAGDENPPVEEGDGFRVIQTGDGRVVHDRYAAAELFGRVVEQGVEVGLVGQSEASNTLLGAVNDEICSVGEGRNARHDPLRWHALNGLFRLRSVGVGRDAVV